MNEPLLELIPPAIWNLLTSDEQLLFLLAEDVLEGRVAADALPAKLRDLRFAREFKESTPWHRDKYNYREFA